VTPYIFVFILPRALDCAANGLEAGAKIGPIHGVAFEAVTFRGHRLDPFEGRGVELQSQGFTVLAHADHNVTVAHASANFDRAGVAADLNVVYPIDRLRELAAEGVIGGVAETHFTVMGSTDPAGMTEAAEQIAGQLRQERIDAVLLSPV
jgi:hypothetical protein